MSKNSNVPLRPRSEGFSSPLDTRAGVWYNVNRRQHQPIRYRSYYYDRETGFYYLQTRYYDPEVGRFINADAFKYLGADGPIHGMNLYSYCGNNPVGNSDPTGCFVWLVALLMVTAIVHFVVDAASETDALMHAEEYKAENVYNAETDSVQIPNSAKFNNPIAQYVYSKYLYENVKRTDGSNYFTGDVYDIVGEWQAHNAAAQLTGVGMIVWPVARCKGVPVSVELLEQMLNYHKRSVHVDLGRSIGAEIDRPEVFWTSQFFKWYNKYYSGDLLNE